MKTSYVQLNFTKPVALEASAGTGKTYSLVRIALLSLLQKHNAPKITELLLVTFTNKATAELRQRLRELLRSLLNQVNPSVFNDFLKEHEYFFEQQTYNIQSNDDKKIIQSLLEKAYMDLDEAPIYTIHGFCQHLLRTYPFESKQNFFFSLTDNEEVLKELIFDFFRQYEQNMPEQLWLGYQSYIMSYPTLIKNDFNELILGSSNVFIQQHRDDNLLKILQEDLNAECILPNKKDRLYFWRIYTDFKKGNSLLNNILHQLSYCNYDQQFHDFWQQLQTNHAIQSNLFILLDTLSNTIPHKMDVSSETNLQPSDNNLSFASWLTYLLKQLNQLGLLDESKLKSKNKSDKRGFSKFFNTCKAYLVVELHKYINQRHRIHRQQRSQLRFNDLIDDIYFILSNKKLKDPLIKAVRNTFRIVLIDEFQDTDHKQWYIFYTFFKPQVHEKNYHNYILIGDPKQSIYHFRGANLRIYSEALATIDLDNICTLTNNYRSNTHVVQAINQLSQPLFPDSYQKITTSNSNAPLLCKDKQPVGGLSFIHPQKENLLSNKDHINKYADKLVLSTIVSLLDPANQYTLYYPESEYFRPVSANDIACLVEENKDANRLKKLLEANRIPCVNLSNENIYDSKEFFFMKLLLKSFVSSSYKKDKILKQLYYHHYLDRFRENNDSKNYHLFLKKIVKLKQKIIKKGIIYVLNKTLEEFNIISSQLNAFHQGERFSVNMNHVQDIILQLIYQKNLYQPKQILLALQTMEESSDFNNQHTKKTLRLEHDEDSIQILTIFKSKGLEYPIVFSYVGLHAVRKISINKALPIKNLENNLNGYHYHPSEAEKTQKEQQNLDEKQRLFYVAITRTMAHMYIPLLATNTLSPLQQFLMKICFIPLENKETKKTGADRIKIIIEKLSCFYPSICVVFHNTEYDFPSTPNIFKSPEVEQASNSILSVKPISSLPMQRTLFIQSYTSLTKNTLPNTNDELIEEVENLFFNKPEKLESSILTITGGSQLGLLIHKLFEEESFHHAKQSKEEFLTNTHIHKRFYLCSQNFFPTVWIEKNITVVKEIFWNVLNKSLPYPLEIPLHQINLQKKYHELSFLIHVTNDFNFIIDDEIYHIKKGFLTGIIDFVFEENNKIYIIDWKSSQLGSTLENYNQYNLREVMKKQLFTLQYYLYLLAVSYYAQLFQPQFDYTKDIGGVYYIFCRGITIDNTTTTGIFFDKPNEKDFNNFKKNFTSTSIQFKEKFT